MHASTDLLRIPPKFGSGYKWPSLSEAYEYVADAELEGGHDALVDAKACLRVFRYLVEKGVVSLDKEQEEASNNNTSNNAGKENNDGRTSPDNNASKSKGSGEVLIHRTARGFVVSGRTFMMREAFKSHGGKWDFVRKEWRFADINSLPLIQELAGLTVDK